MLEEERWRRIFDRHCEHDVETEFNDSNASNRKSLSDAWGNKDGSSSEQTEINDSEHNKKYMDELTLHGINEVIVLSLFVLTGAFMVEKEGLDGDEDGPIPHYCSCQPDVNAKRFHAPEDLKSHSSKESFQSPALAVVYKGVEQTEGAPNNAIVPMMFPLGATSLEEQLGTGNLCAERVAEADIQETFEALVPESCEWLKKQPAGTSGDFGFKHLFGLMCQSFDLTKPQGWAKLLKRLMGHDPYEMPANLSMKNLTVFTSLMFSSKISIGLAFLTGEAPVFAMKQKLLSGESPFPMQHEFSFPFALFEHRDGDILDVTRLKKRSFQQRLKFSASTETGSVQQMIMEHALATSKQESSSLAVVNDDTGTKQYDALLKELHQDALKRILACIEYNLHAAKIVNDYRHMVKSQNSGEISDNYIWNEFLEKMALVKCRPYTDSKAPAIPSWLVHMLTQFDCPRCSTALFTLLCSDKQGVILPTGHACVITSFAPYTDFWDAFFKTQRGIAKLISTHYLIETKHATSIRNKTVFDDLVARRVASELLKAVAAMGTTWDILEAKEVWNEKFPMLCQALFKDKKKETPPGKLICILVQLIFQAAFTGQYSINLGSAINSTSITCTTPIEFAQTFECPKLLALTEGPEGSNDLDLVGFLAEITEEAGESLTLKALEEHLTSVRDDAKAKAKARAEAKAEKATETDDDETSKIKTTPAERRRRRKEGARIFVDNEAAVRTGDDTSDEDSSDSDNQSFTSDENRAKRKKRSSNSGDDHRPTKKPTSSLNSSADNDTGSQTTNEDSNDETTALKRQLEELRTAAETQRTALEDKYKSLKQTHDSEIKAKDDEIKAAAVKYKKLAKDNNGSNGGDKEALLLRHWQNLVVTLATKLQNNGIAHGVKGLTVKNVSTPPPASKTLATNGKSATKDSTAKEGSGGSTGSDEKENRNKKKKKNTDSPRTGPTKSGTVGSAKKATNKANATATQTTRTSPRGTSTNVSTTR